MERWDNGRDNGSVYASQPAICQSHHRVYDRTNVHLGLAYIVHSVDNQTINQPPLPYATALAHHRLT